MSKNNIPFGLDILFRCVVGIYIAGFDIGERPLQCLEETCMFAETNSRKRPGAVIYEQSSMEIF